MRSVHLFSFFIPAFEKNGLNWYNLHLFNPPGLRRAKVKETVNESIFYCQMQHFSGRIALVTD
jgi:hypothetical protein